MAPLTGTTIDTVAFPNTAPDDFWSSTAALPMPGYGWVVNFGYGSTGFNIVSLMDPVRCVR